MSKVVQVKNESPIQRALALAETVSNDSLRAGKQRLQVLAETIAKIQDVKKTLFGVEQGAKAQFEQSLVQMKVEVQDLERQQRVCVGQHPYRRLSLAPLTWRDTNGYPAFALFNLESPTFELSIQVRRDWRGMRYHKNGVPKLPTELKVLYADVYAVLRKRAVNKGRTISLRCSFSGAIPASVKEEIAKAGKIFGLDRLYLLAEPSNFSIEEKAPTVIRSTDPLVVGYDGSQFWLVAAFDVTPAEKLVLEFGRKNEISRS